jgi:hypothetical protein
MLEAAAKAYEACVNARDSAPWAVVMVFRAFRDAARIAHGSSGSPAGLHTSRPMQIVTRKSTTDAWGRPTAVELALPEMLYEHMTDVAAGAYRRSLARKDAPQNAVRRIFKVLRKIALQYYELDDDG